MLVFPHPTLTHTSRRVRGGACAHAGRARRLFVARILPRVSAARAHDRAAVRRARAGYAHWPKMRSIMSAHKPYQTSHSFPRQYISLGIGRHISVFLKRPVQDTVSHRPHDSLPISSLPSDSPPVVRPPQPASSSHRPFSSANRSCCSSRADAWTPSFARPRWSRVRSTCASTRSAALRGRTSARI